MGRSGFVTWIGACLLATAAAAEPRQVGSEAVQLRAGAGTGFPAAGALAPGERVDVVGREAGWAHVRLGDGREGWVGESYLAPDGAPAIDAAGVAALRAELAAAKAEAERHAVSARDAERDRAERERLAAENAELRGRQEWMQWVVGALIFASGMTLGAIVRGLASRRSAGRLRF